MSALTKARALLSLMIIALVITRGSAANAKEEVAEAKVYPAPGAPHITNIEVFEPVATVLYDSSLGKTEKIDDGRFHFEQRTDAMMTCSRKFENDKIQSHFCVMHMLEDGTLLPGTVAQFENETETDPPGARGHGEIRISAKGHSHPRVSAIQISAQAARALFSNLQVPQKAQTKAGVSVACSKDSHDSYLCQVRGRLSASQLALSPLINVVSNPSPKITAR